MLCSVGWGFHGRLEALPGPGISMPYPVKSLIILGFFAVRGEVGEVRFWPLVLERVLVSLCSDVLATPGLPSNRALLMRAVQCIWCGGQEAR